MKYNGNELEEMTPENWDGKSREMLVWSDYSEPCLALVCGFTLKGHPIADTGNYKKENAYKHYVVFQYCADIPKEEKKPRRMTKRELSEWCAKGHGYYRHDEYPNAMTVYIFNINEANNEVPDSIKICGWDEVEWREPMIEE